VASVAVTFRLTLSTTRTAGSTSDQGLEAARQHELLLGLARYRVDAGLIFCQAGTLGRFGLPLALSLRLAQGILSPSSQQSLIFGVSVPRCLPDSPDEVLKLTLRYLDPDPSVWVDPHLALSPYETHPMTELPEPGVLARAVLPQARPTAADGDLSSTSPSPGSSMARIPVTVQESSPGASGELTMPFHPARRGSAATAGKGTKNLLCAYLAIAVFTGLLRAGSTPA
jgi:hypothetical protein